MGEYAGDVGECAGEVGSCTVEGDDNWDIVYSLDEPGEGGDE